MSLRIFRPSYKVLLRPHKALLLASRIASQRTMASNPTLYIRNGACSFIPHVLLLELGLTHQTVVLEINKDNYLAAADGSFTHEEYRKIHPSGYVPALKVDSEIITELPAIVNYIAGLKPDRQLLGKTLLEQAKHEEMMCWISGTIHAQGYGALWRSRRFTDSKDKSIHEAINAGGRKRILDAYDHLENVLAGPHAIGGGFTAVDVTLYNFWRWGALRLGIETEQFKKTYPKFTELAKEVEGMESVKRTLEEENLPLAFK